MKNLLDDYRQVYQMLEDEESRFIYLNRLNYLISGDSKFIDNIIDNHFSKFFSWEDQLIKPLVSKLPADRQFVLFGANRSGYRAMECLREDPRLIGFCSSNKKKQQDGWCGYPVMSPEELLARKDLSVIVSAAHTRDEILQILHDGSYPEELIFVAIPDEFLQFCTDQYFDPGIIRYEEEEVFVDAGCYALETSLELRKRCKRVKKVYAFEPDPKNYEVCLHNKEEHHFPEAEILPYGTWSESTELRFSGEHSVGSCFSKDGDIVVPVRAIDDVVVPEERVTFIKMDIEGSELESLKGARQTIQRDKPKLAICIYHKPEDMTEIPLYIKSLVPEYKFYIRHHNYGDCDTVLYAVL